MSTFHDLPTATLENDSLRLEYLTGFGPRIVGLSYLGSVNLLADVPDVSWDSPYGPYYPLGGHRLWISPEVPARTYVPDVPGLEVKLTPRTVACTAPVEKGSGVSKSLRIELEESRPVVQLLHTIRNGNPQPVTLAPWAISMFRQGGRLILPQPAGNVDPHGLLPNRLLVLWPYSQIKDPRLLLRDDFLLLHARPALPPLKLGYRNTPGWLAYWHAGVLFRKSFDSRPAANYPDGGCNAEVYCGDRFVEMESLGPLVVLEPGESVEHTETWELFPDLEVEFLPQEIQDLLQKE